MQKSRLHYSILNSSVSAIIQVANILIRFILQTVLIKTLGATYLGINGLFTNILSLLSFAELGIGPAIVYSLYKPLAIDDKREISALMNLFRKAYNSIGIIIGILGIILIPFLNLLIKNGDSLKGIHYYFILFLVNSVLSYFFSYKRSLLIADQKSYLSIVNQFIYMIIQTVFQLVSLFWLKNYYLFLMVQILCTLISNITISAKVDREYRFLKSNKKEKVSVKDINTIKKNIAGMIGSKFGTVIVFTTDNLLISSFLGIVQVGIYSNYSMIVTAVTNVLNNITNSVTASIGNLAVTGSNSKMQQVFLRHLFINFVLTLFCSSYLFTLLNPFVTVWIGQKYTFNLLTVIIIVFNFIFAQMRQTALSFITSYGLFWKVGIKSVIEAIVNLVLSCSLIYFGDLGVAGTLLGTILTNLIINSWWEPNLVIKEGLGIKTSRYYIHYIIYIFTIICCCLTSYYCNSLLNIPSFILLFTGVLISTLISSLVLIIFFRNTDGFLFLRRLLLQTIKSRL